MKQDPHGSEMLDEREVAAKPVLIQQGLKKHQNLTILATI